MPLRDDRGADELRKIRLTADFTKHAEGSVLIECGETRVLCTASIEEKIPHFLRGSGKGWCTAEYGMLPRSTGSRVTREASRGRLSGRTQEIQRLIGRSIRSILDLECLGERTIWLDCDVLQADGGTRTASITGAFVATALAVDWMLDRKTLSSSPILDSLAAVSVGIVEGAPMLDLCYLEDSGAEVDMNVVMTSYGEFVEVQGTAEGLPFSRDHLNELIDLASKGIQELIIAQRALLADRCHNFRRLLPHQPATS